MGATLKITFLQPAQVNDHLYFEYYNDWPTNAYLFSRDLQFKTLRIAYGQCTIGATAEAQAINYVNAFVADYNGANFFMIDRIENEVYISCSNESEILNPTIESDIAIAEFEVDENTSNNMIHIIDITPRQYVVPSFLHRAFLISENNLLITTEDGKKIRL
jgi:hypothetical protein